jgi:hypothetical protein
MRYSPDIIEIVFDSIINPIRPKPFNEKEIWFNQLSSGEKIKVRIVYDFWNGTGQAKLMDLYNIDKKDRVQIGQVLSDKPLITLKDIKINI